VWDGWTTTDHHAAIVKCNEELRAREQDPPHIRENLLLQLQVAVSKLYDSKYIKSVSAIPDNAQQSSLLSGLTGKPGRFLGNLLGKRVNNTGRSVLTGDPRLRLNQIGSPGHVRGADHARWSRVVDKRTAKLSQTPHICRRLHRARAILPALLVLPRTPPPPCAPLPLLSPHALPPERHGSSPRF
jgi:hypothetical protein